MSDLQKREVIKPSWSNSENYRYWLAYIAPAISGIAFELTIAPRHDYTGHFLAGYGASLVASLLWLKQAAPETYIALSRRSVLPLCVCFILAGVVTELTIFRFAKFDEIDFCSQSLGAVLAMLVVESYAASAKPESEQFDGGLVAGIIALGIGAVYAAL